MKVFDVYYSGVVTIEAVTETAARNIFYHNYTDLGDIEEVKDKTEDYEKLQKYLDNITDF